MPNVSFFVYSVLAVLAVQVQSGAMDPEQYLKTVSERASRDKILAKVCAPSLELPSLVLLIVLVLLPCHLWHINGLFSFVQYLLHSERKREAVAVLRRSKIMDEEVTNVRAMLASQGEE